MKLSILIPTIHERFPMWSNLVTELYKQIDTCYRSHPTLGQVEVCSDNRAKFIDGGVSVGVKRDSLVQNATGEYLLFLDDDETIPPNYVEQVLRLCNQGKDICTFRSLFKCDTYWALIDMSLKYKRNEDATPEHIVKRKPWHVCAIRSEIAKRHRFSNMNNAEDWDWMERVLKDVKTEAHTSQILHQYNHSKLTSAVDAIK
jgi:hypothetical protein